MDSISYHKYEWKLKSNVVKIILSCGGSIFGGAVRDMYLHDMQAKKFYRNIIALQGINHQANHDLLYRDPHILPDTLGRLTMISDIDAFIKMSDTDKLFETLANAGFTIKEQFTRDPHGYISNTTIIPGQVIHTRYTISGHSITKKRLYRMFHPVLRDMQIVQTAIDAFISNIITLDESKFTIELDLMKIVEESAHVPDAPFGNLDFRCNGLIMDKHGIRLSEHVSPSLRNPVDRTIALTQVLDDVLQTKAIMCEKANSFRVNKMYDKGWILQSSNIIVVKESYSNEGGHCIICHDDCTHLHYKLRCCDARYHSKCITTTLESMAANMSSSCPMCRSFVDYSKTDKVLLETLAVRS